MRSRSYRQDDTQKRLKINAKRKFRQIDPYTNARLCPAKLLSLSENFKTQITRYCSGRTPGCRTFFVGGESVGPGLEVGLAGRWHDWIGCNAVIAQIFRADALRQRLKIATVSYGC